MKAFEIRFEAVGCDDGKKIKVHAEDFAKANELVKIKYPTEYKRISSFVKIKYVEILTE